MPFTTDLSKAVVTVLKGPDCPGQGFWVPSGFVLTASHCLPKIEAHMIDREFDFITEVVAGGKTIKMTPKAVEPIADIAVLGHLDSHSAPDEYDAYLDMRNAMLEIPLSRRGPELKETKIGDTTFQQPADFRVWIYTHDKVLVGAKAQLHSLQSEILWYESEHDIEGGSSGGPVVDEHGEVVSLVSTAGGTEGKTTHCRSCRPLRVLPAWILDEIFAATDEDAS